MYNYLDSLYKIAPNTKMKYSDYSFAPYLFRPNKDQSTRVARIGYVIYTWNICFGTIRNYYVSPT